MSGLALSADMVEGHGSLAHDAGRAPAVHRIILRHAFAGPDLEAHLLLLAVYDRLDPRLLALLLGEPEGAYEWHGCSAGGVGAADGARPEPGDHGLPVRSLRVEVTDPLLGLVAH